MKADIAPAHVVAQQENDVGNYMVVSRKVEATTTYNILGKWVAEIENAPIFMRITEMSLQRDNNSPGSVKVELILSTIFPRPGAGR